MDMLHRPLVSVITINFNQADYTLQMIDSLKLCGYDNIEIIVVDNASANDDVRKVELLYPDVKVLRLTENLGFAGGNNKGLEMAKGTYFLFLNNDTELVPGFLQTMIAVFEQYPDAGMVSPRLNYFNSPGKKTIQYAGSRPMNRFTGRGSNIGWGETDEGQYNFVIESDFAHGAALMFNHRVLDQVGCIPDQYFLYYEELDWCTAMQKKGLKAYYCGTALVYHKESISVGKNSSMKTYYMNRNRLLYLRRNNNKFSFYIALLFYSFVSMPVAIVRFMLHSEFKHLYAYFLAIAWHFSHRKGIRGFPYLEIQPNATKLLVNESKFYKEHIELLKRISA
jgi:GT2 family glycosyltransferase